MGWPTKPDAGLWRMVVDIDDWRIRLRESNQAPHVSTDPVIG